MKKNITYILKNLTVASLFTGGLLVLPQSVFANGNLVTDFGVGGVITGGFTTNTNLMKGVTSDSTGVYVVGYDSTLGTSNLEGRVEKYDLTTGARLWSKTVNPSSGNDQLLDVVVDNTGVYVVGYDSSFGPGNSRWYIEKRSLSTGNLIAGFGVNGVITETFAGGGSANFATIDSTGIYILGSFGSSADRKLSLEKRNLSGALQWSQTINPLAGGDDIPHGVEVDSTGVYVVGASSVTTTVSTGGIPKTSTDSWTFVQKRNLSTGALINTFGTSGSIKIDPTLGNDYIAGVGIDATGLYLAGSDDIQGSIKGRIEKRNLDTGASIWIQSSPVGLLGMVNDNTGLYTMGNVTISGLDTQWHIEKRNLADGNFASAFGTSGVVTSNPGTGLDYADRATTYNGQIYVVGTYITPGYAFDWRLEKRNTVPVVVPPPSTPTVTPDLVANIVTTTSALVAGNPINFLSVIKNIGTGSTTATFPNVFQVADDEAGTNIIDTISGSSVTGLDVNEEKVASAVWVPPAPGVYYVRACADMDLSGVGVVTE